jgi:hypothetical protein
MWAALWYEALVGFICDGIERRESNAYEPGSCEQYALALKQC